MLLWLLNFHEEGLLALRAAVAIIFIVHGLPKLKRPSLWNFLGVVECILAICLFLGIYTQVAALLLALIMVGATYMKIFKWHTPFWSMTSTGWELDFLIFVSCVFIAMHGGGDYSLLGY